MLFSRIGSVCSLASLVGLGFVTSSLGGGTFKNVVRTIRKIVDERDRIYRWICNKWIIGKTPKTKGDVFACNDTRKDKTNSLVFVLWLLPLEGTREYNYPYGVYLEVEQIKLETDKSLSFVFASKENQYKSEKFIDSRGLYWDAEKQQKYPNLDFGKISEKTLKDGCKMEGKKLKCDSYENFEAPSESVTMNIKLSY